MTCKMRWTEEYREYLRENYPFMGCNCFTESFKKHFGIEVSKSSVKQIALAEGVTRYAPSGWYTVAEAAFIFNTTAENLQLRIKRGTMKAKRFGGKRYLISEKEMKRLEKFYINEKLPWPAYTTQQAAERLGYCSTAAINQPAKRGYIESVFIRKRRYVRKSDIEWGLEQMRVKGFTKIPWYMLKKEKEQQKNVS